MSPLALTPSEFVKFEYKNVLIKYHDHKAGPIDVTGVISNIFLSNGAPPEVGTFDFEISQESKKIIEQKNIEIPNNMTPFDILEISLSNII